MSTGEWEDIGGSQALLCLVSCGTELGLYSKSKWKVQETLKQASDMFCLHFRKIPLAAMWRMWGGQC